MQHLTVAEARKFENLWHGMHRALRKSSSGYNSEPNFNENGNLIGWRLRPGTNLRGQRILHRNAVKAQRNLDQYINHLAKLHHVTKNKVSNNFAHHLRNRSTKHYTVGAPLVKRRVVPFNSQRATINRTIGYLMENTGMSRANATRRVLGNVAATGGQVAAAIRTLQRRFRAKRAAKKNPLHAEMNVLRRVPVSGIRMNNGNVRPLKPSDIAKARRYLAEQGFRTVIRRTPRR